MSKIMDTDGTAQGNKQSLLAQERLLEVLRYEPATGIWVWRVDAAQNVKAGSMAGHLNKDGYLRIKIDGVLHKSSRLAFLYMEGRIPEDVDHENRIPNDDHWKNLRGITKQSNQRNRGIQLNNKSGITGVSFHKQGGKWQAHIKVSGKKIYLGYYSDFHNAVFARYCGELKYNWSQSNSNTTAKQYVDRFLGRNN